MLTPAEEFALGQWLSDYPEDMTYNDIIEHIEGEFNNPDILVWGVLMGASQEKIVEIIESTKENFEQMIAKHYTPKEQN